MSTSRSIIDCLRLEHADGDCSEGVGEERRSYGRTSPVLNTRL